MSSRFMALSAQERTLAFDNAALTLHLNAVVLEKDFWVSWLLGLGAVRAVQPWHVSAGAARSSTD